MDKLCSELMGVLVLLLLSVTCTTLPEALRFNVNWSRDGKVPLLLSMKKYNWALKTLPFEGCNPYQG